jgi:uncharacterized protein (DUF2141 family)
MMFQARRWASTAVTLAMLAATWTLAAQTRPSQQTRDTPKRAATGTGLIAGTLVGLDSARPIRRAHVSLTNLGPDAGEIAYSVITDDLGAFAFADLPAGTYSLAASKQGYLDTVYGQKRPGTGRPGTPVALADAQKIEHLTFTMARGGAISGTVVDDNGEAQMAAHVQVFRAVSRSGQRTLQPGDGTLTDDRGAYRIGVLSPGEYVVAVFPQNVASDALSSQQLREAATVIAARAKAGSDEATLATLKDALDRARDLEIPDSDGYAPVYFPGTTQISSATPILIEPGQERVGVDLQLQLVRTAFVSGTVTDPDGSSMQNSIVTQVFLADADQSMAGRPAYSARAGQDGKFSIAGVPPGHYTVLARSTRTVPDSSGPRGSARTTSWWATADAVVEGRNIADVSLVLQKGMTVSGAVKLDASGASFDLSRLRLVLAPVASSGTNDMFTAVVADGSGAFSFLGVPPGRYRLTVGGQPAGWNPKSATFGGRDALDQPLEVKPTEDASGTVTLTTRMPTLSGKLQDSTGQPTSAYTIIVFPGDERLWLPESRRIRATRPATDGRYAFNDLPAGDYRLVAVTDADPGQWFDPAFLRELAAVAMPIVLGEGERRVQDLKVK